MNDERRAPGRIAAAIAAALLAACGADSSTGSNGTGILPSTLVAFVGAGTLVGTEPYSIGTTTLETGTTAFQQDEAAGAGGLRLGMSFAATGTMNGPAAAAVLQNAGTQSTASGPVRTIDAAGQRFTLATLTFLVDANTLYDGVAGFAGLAPGGYVEVSGMPLADLRTLLATRITRTPAPADGHVSVAGRIEAVSAQGITVAGLTVPAPSPGTSPSPGMRARLSGSFDAQAGTLSNSQVTVLTDYLPAATTRVELEGIALDAAATGGAFRLRTPSRDYEVAASPTNVAPAGARVRVIATATSGTSLAPESVTLVSPGPITYRVTGIVSDFVSLAALRVRGEPVDLTTAVIRGGSPSDIANGRRLAIAGVAGAGVLRVSEATIVP